MDSPWVVLYGTYYVLTWVLPLAMLAFVHLEYSAMSRSDETERVFAAMERAARRGVRVRVLFDDWASRRRPGFRDMLARFKLAGIQAHGMLPVRLFTREFSRPDLRNH